jgi:parvulin-like peptidyl-prolyl isomerase
MLAWLHAKNRAGSALHTRVPSPAERMRTLVKSRAQLAFAALVFGLCASTLQHPSAVRADATSTDQERRAGVLCSFEGGQITVGDLEDAIANKDPRTRAALQDPAARKQLLEDLVRYDLLVHEAARRGYAGSTKVVQAVRAETIRAMQTRDIDVKPESIASADVASYFAEHRDRYEHGEQRRASYIQVATAAEASALIAELRGKDRNQFSKRAREISTDARSRSQGGELGYQFRQRKASAPARSDDAIPEAVIEAMFALRKVGDISGKPLPVGGQFGVLMLTALVPPSARTLVQSEDEIREQLAQQRSQSGLGAVVQQLRAEHAPETHPDLLNAITLDPWHALDIPRGFEAAPPDPRAPAVLIKPDGY